MNITYVYSDCVQDRIRIQFRCKNLAEAINRTGIHHANLLNINAFARNTLAAQKICAASDLIVIYRYLYDGILTSLQYWKARDKKIIVDFDQAINDLPKSAPEYSFWFEGTPLAGCGGEGKIINPAPLEQFKWGLGMVHAATVPSVRLADDWSHCVNVSVIPDYINIYQYPVLHPTHEDEVWVGLGHDAQSESFHKSGLGSALEKVCQERSQVRLVLPDYGFDLKINPKQLTGYAPRFFEEWAGILLKLDIGLIPMRGSFDQRLGSGSLLEFMVAKVPWIASEPSMFYEFSQYGQFVSNSAADWETAILHTVDQIDTCQKKAAREAFLFAISQDVSVNIDKVIKVYASIITQP